MKRVHHLEATGIDPATVTLDQVESNIVRCPDPTMAEQMINHIDAMRREGNSVGGILECVARQVPIGLGEPIFDKLEADLAKAVMSLPATKGFEIGSGFAGTLLTGREHNDEFFMEGDRRATAGRGQSPQRCDPRSARADLHGDQSVRRHSGRHFQR